MKHQVDLKAPAFLYLESIFNRKTEDKKTSNFDFNSESFEDFVSTFVNVHLFESEEFRAKSTDYVRRNWDSLISVRPALEKNVDMQAIRKEIEK